MNGEKPKFKPWKDVAKEACDVIKLLEQQLAIQGAILIEAQARGGGK